MGRLKLEEFEHDVSVGCWRRREIINIYIYIFLRGGKHMFL